MGEMEPEGPSAQARRLAATAARPAWGAAIVALVIGVATVWIQYNLAAGIWSPNRDLAVRAERAVAYGEYLDSLATFNEFIWKQAHWAGTDIDTQAKPSGEDLDDQFWSPASSLQAQLASNWATARMLASGTSLEHELNELHAEQWTILQDFKCMAAIQVQDCTSAPSTNAEISDRLRSWSARNTSLTNAFIEKAAEQLD